MTDADIHAFGPPPGAASEAPAFRPLRPRRWWPWLLGAALLLAVVVAATLAAAVMAFDEAARQGLNVTLNGEPWPAGDGKPLAALAAVFGIGLALLIVLLVVPFTVLLALVLAGLAVAVGLAAATGAVALALAVALSPLWLLALLLWLLIRRRPAVAARMTP